MKTTFIVSIFSSHNLLLFLKVDEIHFKMRHGFEDSFQFLSLQNGCSHRTLAVIDFHVVKRRSAGEF